MILRPRLPLPCHPQHPTYSNLLRPRQHTQHQRRGWHSLYKYSHRLSHHPNHFLRPHDITPLKTLTTYSPTSHHRTFTSTPSLLETPPETHYDILGVPPTTDAPTLKKRFYTLSRQHHPDLHPTDPTAVQRFQQISESYSILSDPQKRARYDRDVLHLHHHRHHSRHGSYGTNGPRGTYAGSRPPSGLSKRRSTGIFRGPPPSYFAQGGGGSYQAGYNPYTRDADGEAKPGSSSSSSSSGSTATDGGSSRDAGSASWGPGYGEGAAGDFDSSGVYRTQTHEDRKRNARRAAAQAAAQAAAEEDGDFWARFVIISCTVLGGLMLASLLVGDSSMVGGKRPAGGMVKADGSRRDRDRS